MNWYDVSSFYYNIKENFRLHGKTAMTFNLGNRIFVGIHNVFKSRRRLEHINRLWTLEVNRDSVCAGDDVFGHKILYQIDSDSIDFKEFICKVYLNQIQIISSDFNATFLALVTGGSTWWIFLKSKKNGELFKVAKVKINSQQNIKKSELFQDITI